MAVKVVKTGGKKLPVAKPVKGEKLTSKPQPTAVRSKGSKKRDPMGCRMNMGNRGHVIDIAVIHLGAGGKAFSTQEVAELVGPTSKLGKQYAAIAGGPVESVYAHLRALAATVYPNAKPRVPHLLNTAEGWKFAPLMKQVLKGWKNPPVK